MDGGIKDTSEYQNLGITTGYIKIDILRVYFQLKDEIIRWGNSNKSRVKKRAVRTVNSIYILKYGIFIYEKIMPIYFKPNQVYLKLIHEIL